MKYNHTKLSLAGNEPVSNRQMSGMGIIDDAFSVATAIADVKNQKGKGLFADIGGALAGVAGGIAGSFAGPFGSAAAGAASAYGAKSFLEQQGLGYQYRSPIVKSGLFGYNATGPVSMNMPER